ncbi:hypothetical protein JOM56_012309 [Amanita muscaria]
MFFIPTMLVALSRISARYVPVQIGRCLSTQVLPFSSQHWFLARRTHRPQCKLHKTHTKPFVVQLITRKYVGSCGLTKALEADC